MSRVLYEFRCPDCGGTYDEFGAVGAGASQCPYCLGIGVRTYGGTVAAAASFGKVGVPHEAGRRLSKAEAERREDWAGRNLRNGQRLAATQEKPVTFDIGRGGST